MANQLTVDLHWREDTNGMKYLVGGIQLPASLDLKDGLVFLIWPHEAGSGEFSQMAIRPKDPKKYEKKGDRRDE